MENIQLVSYSLSYCTIFSCNPKIQKIFSIRLSFFEVYRFEISLDYLFFGIENIGSIAGAAIRTIDHQTVSRVGDIIHLGLCHLG